MSSSKRRKIEPQQSPSPAVSALSALAARRRAATANSPAPTEPGPSATSPDAGPARSNAFSALQALKGREHRAPVGAESTEPSQKGNARTPQRRALTQRPPRDQSLDPNQEHQKSPSAKVIQYSSFRPTKRNQRIKDGGTTELKLEESERFLVLGSFGVKVLAGQITVAGATLRPSEKIYWIHAPMCHALPVLRTAENTHLELHQDNVARDLRLLGRLSPLFRRIWNDPTEDVASSHRLKPPTFRILCTSEDAPQKSLIQDLVSPPEWNKVFSALVSSASVLNHWIAFVCGPKSAGKSTFSRLLGNRLLTQIDQSRQTLGGSIALLDLDPGQPEFSPAGTISLIEVKEPNLGTPFTHPGVGDITYSVIRSHALASVSPASSPDLYLQCAADLLQTYKRTLHERPLLVNTPGWILGTGLDLLAELIGSIDPHQVVYLSEDGPAETVETLRAATKHTFTTVPSNQSEFVSRTAAHFRSMQTMSYFHGRPTRPGMLTSSSGWNPASLSTVPPWRVRYQGPRSGILAIVSYDYQPLPHLLADAINGMVLAAVEVEDNEALRGFVGNGVTEGASEDPNLETITNPGALVVRTHEGLPYIPNLDDVALDPRYSRSIGLVLVRGIDRANRELHVLSPIPAQEMEGINKSGRHIILVHGKFDAPTWAYTEDLFERSDQEAGGEKDVEVMDGDTSEDDSDAEPPQVQDARDVQETPWVEVLTGNEKRPVGSKVWRVRRDLGRSGT